MSDELFLNCCKRIESEYARLGHRLGWRFLAGPKATLNPSTEIALITLNPGGDYDPPDHPHASQEKGSAYLVERWDGAQPGQSTLQKQISAMFDHLARRMGKGDYRKLMHGVMSAQFIPFRSPSFERLANKRDSIAFGRQLWREIFQHISPRLVITIDKESFKQLAAIIAEKRQWHDKKAREFPTGWGNYMADVVEFIHPEQEIKLVRLPHLSRFTLFNRTQGQSEIARLMDAITLEKHPD